MTDTEAPSETAMLRLSRATPLCDPFFEQHVYIDGEQVAALAARQTIELPLAPGTHTLRIQSTRATWLTSPTVEVTATAGDVLIFECGNSASGLRMLLSFLYIAAWHDRYLYLKRID